MRKEENMSLAKTIQWLVLEKWELQLVKEVGTSLCRRSENLYEETFCL